MRRILITGGYGFVGKNLVNLFNRRNKSDELFIPSHEDLDLLDFEAVDSYFRENKIDSVIHLASYMAGIGHLLENPLYYLENNLLLNYNIVHASLKNGVKSFLTLGTSCSYNNVTPLPMKEGYLWQNKPENTYGICKLIMLEHLINQSKMKWCYLIPGNLYGPYDHFGEENAHLIPATVRKFEEANEKMSCVSVWGDGSQIRDFMFVEDAVDLIYKAFYDERFYGKPINISLCKGVSVKEIIDLIQKEMKLQHVEVHYDVDKPIGIKEKILSNELLLEIEPNYHFTDIADGLSKTISWYSKEKSL